MSLRFRLLVSHGRRSRLSPSLARSSSSLLFHPTSAAVNLHPNLFSLNLSSHPSVRFPNNPSIFSRAFSTSAVLSSSSATVPSSESSAHPDDPLDVPPSSDASPATSTASDADVSLAKEEHASLLRLLFDGIFDSPGYLTDLLQTTPTAFALETTEALLQSYTEVDHILRRKSGPELAEARKQLVQAAGALHKFWRETLSRPDVSAQSISMHALRVTPDFVSVLTKCEDWETFHELNKWLAVRQAAGISQELSEELVNAISALFDSDVHQPAQRDQTRRRIGSYLIPIFDSSNDAQLSFALKSLWPAFHKHPHQIPVIAFGHLFPVAVRENQVEIVEQMWDAMKREHQMVNQGAQHYIHFLAANGRASEIPQIIQSLLEQKICDVPHWKVAIRSYCQLASDPLAAARLLSTFRHDIAEVSRLRRLVPKLISSEWGPGVTSKEETLKKVRSVLEEADLWGKLEDSAAAERIKTKTNPSDGLSSLSPSLPIEPWTPSALSEHLYSLSLGKLEPLEPLLDRLRHSHPSPAFALETLKSLFNHYSQVDRLLAGKRDEELEAGRQAIADAVRQITSFWDARPGWKDASEEESSAFVTRLAPDLVALCAKLDDWELFLMVASRLKSARIGASAQGVELGEQLEAALSACLNSPKLGTADPMPVRQQIRQLLNLLVDSPHGSPSSTLERVWPVLQKQPKLIPSMVFERLLPGAVRAKQVQLVEEIWDAMKGRRQVAGNYVHHYISFLTTHGRASEIPQAIRCFVRENVLTEYYATRLLYGYCIDASDPISAARFLIDFRSNIAKPVLHLLVYKLISSEWGPGVASREEAMVEVRWRLEKAFGRDLWEKVDEAGAAEEVKEQGRETRRVMNQKKN